MNRNRLVSVFVVMLLVSLTAISVFCADTARANARANDHLQRYENIWVGAAVDNLHERSERAHPPWPAQAAELRELLREIGGVGIRQLTPGELGADREYGGRHEGVDESARRANE